MPVSLYSRYRAIDTVYVNGNKGLAQRLTEGRKPYPGEIVHILVGKETLDQLAFHYYGREDLWWQIADANPCKYPDDWQAGDMVIIPPISVATRTRVK